MTRWIEKNEKMFRCRLRFRSHGTEGGCPLLGLLQIVDV